MVPKSKKKTNKSFRKRPAKVQKTLKKAKKVNQEQVGGQKRPKSCQLKEGFCIFLYLLRPRTFLDCFVLNTLSSKAKQLRNVLGHLICPLVCK